MHLSEDTFETFLSGISDKEVIDLREVTFIDPYGMVGLLEAARHLSSENTHRTLLLPLSSEVLKYLERMDFFNYAGRYLHISPEQPHLSEKYLRSTGSDVLLEITPIEKSDDIHFIVGKVRKRAHAILRKHLHYEERAINGFIVALSEVCQNIIEHSESTGYVGIQKYRFQNLDKNIVKIAVTDLGRGFRKSLSERIAIEGDLDAIDKALLHGISRYDDIGRGHGLAAVRRFVKEWNGKISIRSGSARLSIIPDWSWGKENESRLIPFPGAQISIVLPEI